MKTCILFAALSIAAFVSKAQDPHCSTVRNGTFYAFTPEVGTTVIKRKGPVQVEKNKTVGAKIRYGVKWVDDCTYKLYDVKVIKEKNPSPYEAKPTDTLTVKIINVTATGYSFSATSNFSDFILEMEVKKK